MSSPFFTFFNFFYIIKGPHRKGVKRGARCTPYHVTINSWGEHPEGLKGVILPYTRHSFVSGNRGLCNLHLKYEGDSLRAVFWNCPKPYILEVYRISLDTSTAKLWGSSGVSGIIVYPHRLPKTTMSFFLSTKFLSKGVTPMILRQIDSCIAHYRPYLDTL